MKEFIAVLLVCFLGAASAGLTPPAVKPLKTPDDCRHQAYLETVNCTKFGFNHGSAELECLSVTVVNYIECLDETKPPTASRGKLQPLGGSLAGIGQGTVDKFKCLFNNILDTLKCTVNGQIESGLLFLNWSVIVKCLVTNVPGLLVCFPQQLGYTTSSSDIDAIGIVY